MCLEWILGLQILWCHHGHYWKLEAALLTVSLKSYWVSTCNLVKYWCNLRQHFQLFYFYLLSPGWFIFYDLLQSVTFWCMFTIFAFLSAHLIFKSHELIFDFWLIVVSQSSKLCNIFPKNIVNDNLLLQADQV